MTTRLITFDATVWRILAAEYADQPLAPARAPEGRFHYDGQTAIYTSLSPEGAGVAIKRYLSDDGPARVIVGLALSAAQILDMRNTQSDVEASTLIWQDQRAQGQRASTWDISDKARADGAQGILYRSRSRPDLSHLTLFGRPDPGTLHQIAPAQRWP